MRIRIVASGGDSQVSVMRLGSKNPIANGAHPLPLHGQQDARCRKQQRIAIRQVRQEEYWAVASMHCDAFYPKVSQSGFWGPLLKLDRVVAMELGTDKRLGNFECLIALNDSENGTEDGRQVGSIPGAGQVLDFIFRMLIPPQVLEKYVVDYERAGIVGAVVVDTFMEHVPSARKGRRRVNTAYLSNLAVSPLRRRMGVGSALLARAEEVAGSWGCAFMTLHVDASNNAGIELYRSAGYRFVARQPEWQRILEGRSTGLVLMVKRLKSS